MVGFGMRPRLTARLRLTLLYGVLFLTAGAILLVLNYALMRRNLTSSPTFTISSNFISTLGTPPARVSPAGRQITAGSASPELERERRRLRDATLSALVRQSTIALGAMTVASAGLGWWFAGRALRPVHDITAVARRLSEERLHERIALAGPEDELKELADTFDAMLARLERAFEGQRRFVANASHELRTPLTIARTEIDVTLGDPNATSAELRAMGETVRAATVRSERLIDGLLTLARSSAVADRREPVDLAAAVTLALDQNRSEAKARGVRIDARLAPAVTVGDRSLLERLAANLVENAVRHNEPNGWIAITTETAADKARLMLANGGPAIPPVDVEPLFEPFRRRRQTRTGSDHGAGLGLSIVRAIATAHGGAAMARALPEGGLEVIVEVPVR